MKKGTGFYADFFIRYSILLVAGIFNTNLFYLLFTSITIYPVYFLLNLFFDVTLSSNLLWVNNFPIEIIGPCVAGSAYYLLLILNLATPKINFKKRILSLLFSFALLLLVNILRIFGLSLLFISGSPLFDIIHKLIWILGSIAFVIGIWFITVKVFKIKEIPFYSDVSSLINLKKNKKTKSHKKYN